MKSYPLVKECKRGKQSFLLIIFSSRLLQSIEEQQQRIDNLKKEMTSQPEMKEEMKSKITQQIQRETEYLNDRLFLSSSTLFPNRSPLEVWIEYVY